jgi:hypothetical protein
LPSAWVAGGGRAACQQQRSCSHPARSRVHPVAAEGVRGWLRRRSRQAGARARSAGPRSAGRAHMGSLHHCCLQRGGRVSRCCRCAGAGFPSAQRDCHRTSCAVVCCSLAPPTSRKAAQPLTPGADTHGPRALRWYSRVARPDGASTAGSAANCTQGLIHVVEPRCDDEVCGSSSSSNSVWQRVVPGRWRACSPGGRSARSMGAITALYTFSGRIHGSVTPSST